MRDDASSRDRILGLMIQWMRAPYGPPGSYRWPKAWLGRFFLVLGQTTTGRSRSAGAVHIPHHPESPVSDAWRERPLAR